MADPESVGEETFTVGILAGEISGDNLAAPLLREIRNRIPGARFVGAGGPAMIANGLESWVDMDRLSVNGFSDPIRRLPEFVRLFFEIRSRMLRERPDCFIGVDYNFFNLLLEGSLRKRGIRTVHYVSPTIWAWRSWRIRKIRRNVDMMLTLFPFETDIYERHGVPVAWVGHPLTQEIAPDAEEDRRQASRSTLGYDDADELIALLPGSRRSEVGYSGPGFLAAAVLIARERPGVRFLIPAANEKRKAQIESLLECLPEPVDVRLIVGASREILASANAAIINSGTATLEALLLGTPMVMSYKLSPLTYAIVSRLTSIPYFALPNILAGRELIPEFIQDAATPTALAEATLSLFDPSVRNPMIEEFHRIHDHLQTDSGGRAAQAVLALCGRDDE